MTAPVRAMVWSCSMAGRATVAQTAARLFPDRVRALVVSPPLPGAGNRVLEPAAEQEFWYQAFHQLSLVEEIIDGRPDAVRAYLRHFWSHWSGRSFVPADVELDRLADVYGRPGAFAASIAWYRAGAGTVARSLAEVTPARDERIAAPTTVLWPEFDPLFPPSWATGSPSSSPTQRSPRCRASATSSRSKRPVSSPLRSAPPSRSHTSRRRHPGLNRSSQQCLST